MARMPSRRSATFTGAAALTLVVAALAQAQQAQPSAATAQPAVGLGIGIGEVAEGATITAVAPGGTAAALGLRPGDVLLRLGQRPVTAQQVVSEYVQSLKVGDPVIVLVRRDGRTLTLTGRALARPAAPPPPPDRSTPVEANELRETWNDRASQGPLITGLREFNGWSVGAAMPLPRATHAVTELRGKVWVLGGYPPGRLPSNLVQIFDPTTSRWSLGPTLPQPMHHTMVKAVDGKLYMIGGEIDGAGSGRPETFLAGVWMHDPSVGGWVARAPMPTARSGGGVAVLGGKVYVAGGRPPNGSAFEAYDPVTNSWEKLPDLPTQRNHLAMAAIDGKIIVAGGRTTQNAFSLVDTVEIYDPATRRWTRGAPIPEPRGGIAGVAHAGCMFIFGGEGNANHVLSLTPTTYAYDPRVDRWTKLSDLPIPVHGIEGGAVIEGRIFLPGGGVTLGGNSGTNAMQLYRPTMKCE